MLGFISWTLKYLNLLYYFRSRMFYWSAVTLSSFAITWLNTLAHFSLDSYFASVFANGLLKNAKKPPRGWFYIRVRCLKIHIHSIPDWLDLGRFHCLCLSPRCLSPFLWWILSVGRYKGVERVANISWTKQVFSLVRYVTLKYENPREKTYTNLKIQIFQKTASLTFTV